MKLRLERRGTGYFDEKKVEISYFLQNEQKIEFDS